MSNIQQVIQQGTFGMLKACDSLLTTPTDTKTALSHTIDALALMGHAVGALSRIRRDNIKPTLNPVYYSLCNRADDPVPHSPLLFGDDLAKQVRDAKETSNISQSLGVSRNRQPRNNRSTYRYDNRFANSRQPRGNQFEYRRTTSLIFWGRARKNRCSKPNPAGNLEHS